MENKNIGFKITKEEIEQCNIYLNCDHLQIGSPTDKPIYDFYPIDYGKYKCNKCGAIMEEFNIKNLAENYLKISLETINSDIFSEGLMKLLENEYQDIFRILDNGTLSKYLDNSFYYKINEELIYYLNSYTLPDRSTEVNINKLMHLIMTYFRSDRFKLYVMGEAFKSYYKEVNNNGKGI